MPWSTPSLRATREMVRDEVTASLSGAAFIGNNVLRVVSDAMAGLCHLVLRYIDWLALQLLPDTAETEWLDRHGYIWLQNSDGTWGRKRATLAQGWANFTGTPGTIVPQATRLTIGELEYETLDEIAIGEGDSPARVRALDPGAAGNQETGTAMTITTPISGVGDNPTVAVLEGGTDQETDDELRYRVLLRIRNPPAGGAAHDYVQWALAVPGVTRAWCSPLSMGMGTVSIRVMMDGLRATDDPLTSGFPLPQDLVRVAAYIDSVRPVAIKDTFVLAPIPEPIDFTIQGLVRDTESIRGAIALNVEDMIYERAAPAHAVEGIAQPATTIWNAWVNNAIFDTPDVESFTLIMQDHPMPHDGALAVIGTITYI